MTRDLPFAAGPFRFAPGGFVELYKKPPLRRSFLRGVGRS